MAKAAPAKTPDLNIDLIPKESSETGKEAIHWTLTVGRYLIIFTEIIALATFVAALFLSKQKNDLRSSVKTKQSFIEAYQTCDPLNPEEFCEDRFRKVQDQINQVAGLQTGQFQTNKVVSEFLTLLPVGIKLEDLSIDKNTVTFSGTLPSETELQTLIDSFNKSTKLTSLDITSLTKESNSLKFSSSVVINKASFSNQ